MKKRTRCKSNIVQRSSNITRVGRRVVVKLITGTKMHKSELIKQRY